MKRTLQFSTILFGLVPVFTFGINSWDIDGLHGTLTVNGMMTEAPCTMDVTNSKRQEVSLGEILLIHSVNLVIELSQCHSN